MLPLTIGPAPLTTFPAARIYEQIAHTLIKENLRRHTGVGATDDNRIRRLCRRDLREVGRASSRIQRFSRHKTFVAFEQVFESFVGGQAPRLRREGAGCK